MKKITLIFVGVLTCAFTLAGPVEKNPKSSAGMAVVKRDESSFNLIYKSEQASDVKVQIFNEQKNLVFSEMMYNSNGFSRPYNFSGLKEGDYTIQLDNGTTGMAETVHYIKGEPEKLAQLIHMSNGKYLLTVAGQGLNVISIIVRNEIGQTVHSENAPVDGNFAKVYDLRAIQGDFAFEIKDNKGASKTLWKP